jgi:hypothetical protein
MLDVTELCHFTVFVSEEMYLTFAVNTTLPCKLNIFGHEHLSYSLLACDENTRNSWHSEL